MSAADAAAVRESGVLGGRVRLLQPVRGYRAGLDAALLAAACDAQDGERVVEWGCGVGGALLAAAARRPGAVFHGVERDAGALVLCSRNIALNGLEGRLDARAGDVALGPAPLGLEPADLAMANPPFFDDPAALRAPAPGKRGAWMADDGLGVWLKALLGSVRHGGRLLVIHRADRLGDLLAGLTGSAQVRPVQPYAEEPAKRVLVRAVRGGRAPLRLLPALVLHDRTGAKHTPQAEAILRGEAALDWL